MKQLFGTDGIRAHAGSFPLDKNTVKTIGRSLARQCAEKLGRQPRFVTGRDTRESGEWIESAFHAGALEQGAVVESADVITTPGVAFVTGAFDFDAGIVVSASHNPYEDNGIKIFDPSGKKIARETESAIEADIAGQAETSESGDVEMKTERAAVFQQAYLDHLYKDHSGLDLSGFKIVVDCANGAASNLAPSLLKRFGAEVIAFNDQPNGRNINHDCGSMHLEHLQARVVAEKANFGVAYDGDADRALFADENGNVVDGDGILWIMSQHLMEHDQLLNKMVVATVMSNIGLEIALAGSGIKLLRAPVGDKYVLAELLQTGAEIGGEQSGHIIFPKKSLVGDGMMTTLFVLDAVRESRLPFSKMLRGFTRYPQILVNVKVREKQPFDNVAEIATAAASIENELDGHGRLLLRYSGTENLARVMIEGKDQAAIENQANRLAAVISSSLG